MKKLLSLLACIVFTAGLSTAHEGMWMLNKLKQIR